MKSARKTVEKEKEIDESEHGDVTPACDDDQETEAHKDLHKMWIKSIGIKRKWKSS